MHNVIIAITAVLSPMMTIITSSAIVSWRKALRVMCSLMINNNDVVGANQQLFIKFIRILHSLTFAL